MVMQIKFNLKHFKVKCPNCEIEEIMTFRSKFYFTVLSCSAKGKVPLFYIFSKTTTLNDSGVYQPNIFSPINSFFGDKLPEKCPLCKGILKAQNFIIQY